MPDSASPDLLLSYWPLAQAAAYSVFRGLPRGMMSELDDAESVALCGIWNALKRAPSASDALLMLKAKSAVLDWLRIYGPAKRSGRPRYPLCLSQVERWVESAGEANADLAAVDLRDECEAVLRRFEPRVARILRLHYLEGLTEVAVGKRVGLTGSRINQILRQVTA